MSISIRFNAARQRSQYGALVKSEPMGLEAFPALFSSAKLLNCRQAVTIISGSEVEAPLSEIEPIQLRPRHAGGQTLTRNLGSAKEHQPVVAFDRLELSEILRVYGRAVAAGEWRDYAIDLSHDKATFCVYRRTSEWPLYRIEKAPKLARRQGSFSVIAATGLIVKRGNDLTRVLDVFNKKLEAVD